MLPETYLKAGITLALAGKQKEARQAFQDLIHLYPDRPEGHYNLGLLAQRETRLDEAEAHLRRALALKPDYTEALYALGLLLKDSQRPECAAAVLFLAAKLNPASPYTYFQLGLVLHTLNHLDGAKACFTMALDLKPDFAEAYNNLALVVAAAGELHRAQFYLDQALAVRPNYTEAYNNRGILLSQAQLPEEAVRAFRQALQLEPGNPVTHNNLGLTYQKLQRLPEALSSFQTALELQPHYVEAHNNLALILHELNRPVEAITHLNRALALKPDFALAATNLVSVLNKLNRFSEAEACLRQALTYHPGRPGLLRRLALILRKQERYTEAEDYYQQAIQNGAPAKTAEAVFGLGTLYLLQGRYRPGWDYYEKRLIAFSYSQPPLPSWQGENISDRRLLLFFEQGFGDTLHFIRYATLFTSLATAVGVVVQKPLLRLLAHSLDCPVYAEGQVPLEEYDIACSLHSLPYRFGTEEASIPTAIPYLKPPVTQVTKWRKRLADLMPGRPRIGIVWAGNPRHDNDHNRSIPFSVFRTLPERHPQIHWISLQADDRAADLTDGDSAILNVSAELNDFTETAGLISHLDLVITVDSAVAHLAGALGKPVWILLPLDPDWRWLLTRQDSPWYPSARLFRQSQTGGWQAVLEQVTAALLDEAAASSTRKKP
ncbi:tetratricopeptide repeat protein [Propionispora hippei]|uniref:Flp pilus assembly protein TadD, contains TPR repeats n=1 Tax=Propionispora hippei DSM 15287 TaxID=1123003 RepID=A0A1M6MQD0_9FIRM|nr:tetratricopeptide repeat protein [Propionispora hippei]SHJ85606.1 Flp pilus assembly protein TadD, contains TPR repeats [Propionispora hippei DSM 15287]